MWRWLEDSEIVHMNAEERDDGERLGLERGLTSKGGFKKAFVRGRRGKRGGGPAGKRVFEWARQARGRRATSELSGH
jgi:hypothetical protein